MDTQKVKAAAVFACIGISMSMVLSVSMFLFFPILAREIVLMNLFVNLFVLVGHVFLLIFFMTFANAIPDEKPAMPVKKAVMTLKKAAPAKKKVAAKKPTATKKTAKK